MSTILDSLKKSSDQRDDDNGRSIDKFTFSDQKKSSKRLLSMLLLLLVVLLVAYFGYQYLYQQEPQMTEQKQVEQPEKIENVNNKDNKDVASQKKTDLALVNAKAQQLNDKRAEPKKPKPNSKQVKREMLSLKRQKNNAVKTDQLAQLKKQQDSAVETLTMTDASEKPSDLKAIPTLNDVKNNGRPKRSGTKRDTPRAQQKRAAKQQKYLFLYQLPFAIRKDIPKIKLNIHVYDDDPEKRIAILNGVRFAVNDTIEEGIFLKDIVEEGAILEAAGQEFLIPK